MKEIVTIIILSFWSQIIYGQVGIYKSHQDFINEDLQIYSEYIATKNKSGLFALLLKDIDGQNVILPLKKQNVWGYQKDNGIVIRVNQNNTPYLIYLHGKITVYLNYDASIQLNEQTIKEALYCEEFPPQISLGSDGRMLRLSKKNLKKILLTDPKALSSLKKHSIFYEELLDFIIAYNDDNILYNTL